MFEDSTFESTGRIRTRSRGWAIAALGLNSAILLALVVIPLIHPEALPRQRTAYLMATPPPPPPAPLAERRPEPRAAQAAVAVQDPFAAPRRIPPNIVILSRPEPAPVGPAGLPESAIGVPGGDPSVFPPMTQPRVVVRPAPKATARISSVLAAGLVIYKPIPRYPPIARVAHQEGTVVLAATISKDGTIINLHVVSGPAMLQGAAVDAVRNWRYRPYMLNGEPVDVETTINVNFTLGG